MVQEINLEIIESPKIDVSISNDTRIELKIGDGGLQNSKFIGLLDTPNNYDDGKFLRSTSNGIIYDEIFTPNLDWNEILNKPSTFPPSSHTHTESQITDLKDYALQTSFLTHTSNTNNPHQTSFLKLTDTPSVYAGQANRFIKVNSSTNALEFTDIDANTLTDVTITTPTNNQILKYNTTTSQWVNSNNEQAVWGNISGTLSNQTDLNNALSGKLSTLSNQSIGNLQDVDITGVSNGYILSWNNALTRFEPVEPAGVIATFIGLEDTPSNYTSQNNKLVAVTSDASGLEFIDPPSGNFIGLSDTPEEYTGQQGKTLFVNSTEDGLEFGDPPSATWGNITGTLSNQTDLNNVLVSKATGISSSTTDGLVLFSNTGGKQLKNSGKTLIEEVRLIATASHDSVPSERAVREAIDNQIKFPNNDIGINFIIQGGLTPIEAGVKGDIVLPFDCELKEVVLLANETGSIEIDIWKRDYEGYPANETHSITDNNNLIITNSDKIKEDTLTGWTKTFNKGDILRFNVVSCSLIKRVNIALLLEKI